MGILNWYGEHPCIGTFLLLVAAKTLIYVVGMIRGYRFTDDDDLP